MDTKHLDTTLIPARIWAKLAESEVKSYDGIPCWEFQGRIEASGYGRVWWNGKPELVHRLFAETYHGDAGEVTEHKCNNRACCNPFHTEPSTHLDNMRYMVACGRHRNGAKGKIAEEA